MSVLNMTQSAKGNPVLAIGTLIVNRASAAALLDAVTNERDTLVTHLHTLMGLQVQAQAEREAKKAAKPDKPAPAPAAPKPTPVVQAPAPPTPVVVKPTPPPPPAPAPTSLGTVRYEGKDRPVLARGKRKGQTYVKLEIPGNVRHPWFRLTTDSRYPGIPFARAAQVPAGEIVPEGTSPTPTPVVKPLPNVQVKPLAPKPTPTPTPVVDKPARTVLRELVDGDVLVTLFTDGTYTLVDTAVAV